MSRKKEPQVIFNESLPVIPADNLWLSVRTDDLCYLRFFLGLPKGVREQARLLIMKKDLKRMLNDLCDDLDHFPMPKKKKVIKKNKKVQLKQLEQI
jgi:hypothetical protein